VRCARPGERRCHDRSIAAYVLPYNGIPVRFDTCRSRAVPTDGGEAVGVGLTVCRASGLPGQVVPAGRRLTVTVGPAGRRRSSIRQVTGWVGASRAVQAHQLSNDVGHLAGRGPCPPVPDLVASVPGHRVMPGALRLSYDMVLCGAESTDDQLSAMPALLAERLGVL
jgi:hypothetical protein